MKRQKIALIYGTRPEVIKLAPVIRVLKERNVPFFCIHTGQHYSFEMDAVFFEEFSLPSPDYRLDIDIGSIKSRGEQVASMVLKIEKILLNEEPSTVVVQGDTNSSLAGALSTLKIPATDSLPRIRLVHIEAGLRSYDWRMPEEMNRIIIDHLSDTLFVPTKTEQDILFKEGISSDKVFVVGNTIVDMVKQMANREREVPSLEDSFGVSKNSYILLTIHRKENVDSRDILSNLIKGASQFSNEVGIPIIFPIHPRTKKALQDFDIVLPKEIKVIKPTNYSDFLFLEANASVVLTDSGGVQEESCVLKVPCVTLRDNTERPETVAVGANIIAGTRPEKILTGASMMIVTPRTWESPLGDGQTGKMIVDNITS